MKNIINIINFVRGVEPRTERDLKRPIVEQLRIMEKYGLCGTFLLQYDALCDKEMTELLKNAPKGIEVGMWLEVVQPQVESVGLEWHGRYPWDWYNDVGFLVGYEPEERKRLIDAHVEKFKEVFGYAPRVAGSWHIDAVSLKYLSEKYNVIACCNCRDQVGTDGYTLQGAYYNQAYYPCVNNMFAPAQTEENQIDIPVFRMLGSSPAFAYDFQLFDYDGIGRVIPTLEPVWLSSGKEWNDYMLEDIFAGSGISFQYTQLGQENSFGWEKMCDGTELQFKKAADMQRLGQAEVLTLGQAGEWYRASFKTTPPAAYTAQRRWKTNDVKSYWYCSKYYRVNFFAENGILRMRDMYVFNEKYAEKYLDVRCATHSCEYRNLPVLDGVLYSNVESGIKAGCYFVKDDGDIRWNDISYEETETEAVLSLKADCGSLKLLLGEEKIAVETDIFGLKLVSRYDKNNVYGNKAKAEARTKAFANGNAAGDFNVTFITSAEVCDNTACFEFDGFKYSFKVEKGSITDSFELLPSSDGALTVSLLQK